MHTAKGSKRNVFLDFKLWMQKKLGGRMLRNLSLFMDDPAQVKGHALLYYKTDPFLSSKVAHRFDHANNDEIVQKVKVLNELGYLVDIVDRTARKDELVFEDKYAIYIGLGAGDSGRHFGYIASQVPHAKRVLYAAGPDPILSNAKILERYEAFYQRHKLRLKPMRMIKEADITSFMHHTDALFVVGNSFSLESYKKYGKPMYRMNGTTAPHLLASTSPRNPKKFLYFGGSGNLVKGLDLILEAFIDTPLELHVCCPTTGEEDFFAFYDSYFKSKNIHFEGFVTPTSQRFLELTDACAFIILASCSEGTANSVITCMKRGLVPMVTYESGVDIDGFGISLVPDVASIQSSVLAASRLPAPLLAKKSAASAAASSTYSRERYQLVFKKAVQEVLSCAASAE